MIFGLLETENLVCEIILDYEEGDTHQNSKIRRVHK